MAVSKELVLETRQAFAEYEEVFVTRIAKRPGDRMSAEHTENILATGDEDTIRDYIDSLRRAVADIKSATLV